MSVKHAPKCYHRLKGLSYTGLMQIGKLLRKKTCKLLSLMLIVATFDPRLEGLCQASLILWQGCLMLDFK